MVAGVANAVEGDNVLIKAGNTPAATNRFGYPITHSL
jgi:hypothetical protein